MASRTPSDPRLRRDATEADIRPIVASGSSGLPFWLIALGLVVSAVLLFTILDARRRAASAPPVRARSDDAIGNAQPIPSLFVPPPPVPAPIPTPLATPTPVPIVKPPPFIPPPPQRIVYLPQPGPPAVVLQAPPRVSSGPVLVVDTGSGVTATPATNGEANGAASDNTSGASARATVLRHRATVVAQGTLIPAVLESALDSTRAGPVRALVDRDVRGFDGSRVLVPRGSRLFGDYRADLQPGQNRALIAWTRLVRPDGATIALGSPASDPLGRAGIRGKVNSHFLARFGAAILQSALDVGVNVASRLSAGNSSVVVALPGTSQALAQPLTQGVQIQPTLRVRQGTAISVFVARDLDFTAVENAK